MLAFKAEFKITSATEESKIFNEAKYNVFKAEVGDLTDMLIFISESETIEAGMCIRTEKAYLTNYEDVKSPENLALRVDNVIVIPEDDYVRMDALVVDVNGKFIKSRQSNLKKIGVMNRPFICTTLSVTNEREKHFNILLVGHCGRAKVLADLPTNTYVDLVGRVSRLRKGPAGFEINMLLLKVIE